MSQMSKRTKERITQEILRVLFEANLIAMSTNTISEELIRDDELVLSLLQDLHKMKVVKLVSDSRTRLWTLTPEAYSEYKKLSR